MLNHDKIDVLSFAFDPESKAIVKRAREKKAALRAQVREMEERGELNL